MDAIRKAYKKKYGSDLTEDIISKCGESGHMLAQVAGKNPPQGGAAGKAKVICSFMLCVKISVACNLVFVSTGCYCAKILFNVLVII